MTESRDGYLRTSLSLKDYDTYRWVQRYCEFHKITVSEFTERLWRKFHKEHGEMFLTSGDWTPEFLKKKL